VNPHLVEVIGANVVFPAHKNPTNCEARGRPEQSCRTQELCEGY
jgi:hypothetical protein